MNVGSTFEANAKTTKVEATHEYVMGTHCIDEDVMLGTWSRAIRGVRTSFSPAPTARTDDESTAAREKSSSPTSRNFASSSSCNRSKRRPSANRSPLAYA